MKIQEKKTQIGNSKNYKTLKIYTYAIFFFFFFGIRNFFQKDKINTIKIHLFFVFILLQKEMTLHNIRI